MLYSMGTGYALRALSALPKDGRYILAKDLANRLDLPAAYLAKVLKILVHEGLLASLRGPSGGYRLARAAHLIRVDQVIAALNRAEPLAECSIACLSCSHRSDLCPLQMACREAKAVLDQHLERITIQDLQGCFRASS
jgi:Rrf2 family protein